MGCMLLLSDINGCNEIVNNGVDGILVPVKDSNALAKAMIDTRKNIERTDYFASQIKEKIKSSYNQKKIWNLILNEYTERLKNNLIAFLNNKNRSIEVNKKSIHDFSL